MVSVYSCCAGVRGTCAGAGAGGSGRVTVCSCAGVGAGGRVTVSMWKVESEGGWWRVKVKCG